MTFTGSSQSSGQFQDMWRQGPPVCLSYPTPPTCPPYPTLPCPTPPYPRMHERCLGAPQAGLRRPQLGPRGLVRRVGVAGQRPELLLLRDRGAPSGLEGRLVALHPGLQLLKSPAQAAGWMEEGGELFKR